MIEHVALGLSVINTIVGVCVFMIHCRGDKRRNWEMNNRIDKL